MGFVYSGISRHFQWKAIKFGCSTIPLERLRNQDLIKLNIAEDIIHSKGIVVHGMLKNYYYGEIEQEIIGLLTDFGMSLKETDKRLYIRNIGDIGGLSEYFMIDTQGPSMSKLILDIESSKISNKSKLFATSSIMKYAYMLRMANRKKKYA